MLGDLGLGVYGDALQEAERDDADHQATPPVTDERQRYAGHRHYPHSHPDVDEHVEQEDGRHSDGDKHPEAVPGDGRDVEYAPDQEEEQHDEHDAPHEAYPLGEVGEDEVRVVLWQEAQVGERRRVEPLAGEPPGAYRHL